MKFLRKKNSLCNSVVFSSHEKKKTSVKNQQKQSRTRDIIQFKKA